MSAEPSYRLPCSNTLAHASKFLLLKINPLCSIIGQIPDKRFLLVFVNQVKSFL